MTRPIGRYEHPRPSKLHQGHFTRAARYIAARFTLKEVGQLTGMERTRLWRLRQTLRATVAAATFAGLVAFLPVPAVAAPPPGANPNSAIGKWVQSLKTPEGYSCCSEADCRRTAMVMHEDGTRWAWIGKEEYGEGAPDDWMPITEKVWNETTSDGDPPDGRAYVCFYGGRVNCAKSAGGY